MTGRYNKGNTKGKLDKINKKGSGRKYPPCTKKKKKKKQKIIIMGFLD